jgi:antitoxin HicB
MQIPFAGLAVAADASVLMADQGLTKSELAKRMKTSRAQLDRLLDPDNESVTLGTLTRAAHTVGRQLRMELV